MTSGALKSWDLGHFRTLQGQPHVRRLRPDRHHLPPQFAAFDRAEGNFSAVRTEDQLANLVEGLSLSGCRDDEALRPLLRPIGDDFPVAAERGRTDVLELLSPPTPHDDAP